MGIVGCTERVPGGTRKIPLERAEPMPVKLAVARDFPPLHAEPIQRAVTAALEGLTASTSAALTLAID
jgi:hypothetical protein